jgi:hypothetical protein
VSDIFKLLTRNWLRSGFETVDQILRRHNGAEVKQGYQEATGGLPLRKVVAVVLIGSPLYGAAMGSFAFVTGQRGLGEQLPQLIYSGVKVPLLLAITVIISLPSFFIINTLLGLRDDFRDALRAIVSAQAGLAIILVALFPITLFAYASLSQTAICYSFAILFNAAMFGLASVSAQVLLTSHYKELIKRNSRHRWMVRMWIFVYAFVGIQAGYVLRPFIGSPEIAPSLLRRESFQNAYVKVFSLICDIVEGML